MRILLTIAYLGTNYHGWQVQPNGITVQKIMQDALESVYKVRPNLTGCSRTDAGVHANEFCCHYDVDSYITEKGIVCALNTKLPRDVRVIKCKYVDDDFHARYSALGKEYVYRIYNSPTSNPFESDRSLHVTKQLDIEKMNRFAKGLCGTNDFIAFSSSGRTVEDTVRTIDYCKVDKCENIVTITVAANGFLYNMVRIIVGTLLEVSDGKIPVDDAYNIISSKDRNKAGPTAPAHGLFLNKVFY